MRTKTLVAVVMAAAAGGCKSEGGDRRDPGGAGASRPGGATACTATVSGALAAELPGCVATANYFAGGGIVEGKPDWIFTVVLPKPADGPVKQFGINFALPGEPKAGTFTLRDAADPAHTTAFVHDAAGASFEKLQSVELTIGTLGTASEQDVGGKVVRSHQVDGTLAMTLAGGGGKTVTVSARF